MATSHIPLLKAVFHIRLQPAQTHIPLLKAVLHIRLQLAMLRVHLLEARIHNRPQPAQTHIRRQLPRIPPVPSQFHAADYKPAGTQELQQQLR
jgi:hypothetical protein